MPGQNNRYLYDSARTNLVGALVCVHPAGSGGVPQSWRYGPGAALTVAPPRDLPAGQCEQREAPRSVCVVGKPGRGIPPASVNLEVGTVRMGTDIWSGLCLTRAPDTDDHVAVNGQLVTDTSPRPLPFQSVVRVEQQLLVVTEFPPTVQRGVSVGVGHSASLANVSRNAQDAATGSLAVHIAGASGVGKEVVARAIHAASGGGPFVAVNCGAIPETLLESELFGHLRGAFTGAVRDKRGAFEQADGGTLFLDEIADLPLKQHAALLRVLQEGLVRRVGGSSDRSVDVRVISATDQDLEKRVEEGAFREALYWRLRTIIIQVPRLSERREDILILARHFRHRDLDDLEVDFLEAMLLHDWRGNVRELEGLAKQAVFQESNPDYATLKHLAKAHWVKPPARAMLTASASSAPFAADPSVVRTPALPDCILPEGYEVPVPHRKPLFDSPLQAAVLLAANGWVFSRAAAAIERKSEMPLRRALRDNFGFLVRDERTGERRFDREGLREWHRPFESPRGLGHLMEREGWELASTVQALGHGCERSQVAAATAHWVLWHLEGWGYVDRHGAADLALFRQTWEAGNRDAADNEAGG